MNKNNFDKQIREKLAQHEVKPNPAVWESIQGQLAASAQRQYGWLAGLFFMLVLAGAIYYFTLEESPAPEETSEVPAMQQLDPVSDPSFSDRNASMDKPEEFTGSVSSTESTASASASTSSEVASLKSSAKAANTDVRESISKSTTRDVVLSSDTKNSSRASQSSISDDAELVSQQDQSTQKASLPSRSNATLEGSRQNSTPAERESSESNQSSDLIAQQAQGSQPEQTAEASDNASLVEKAWDSRLLAMENMSSAEDYTPVQTAAFLTLEERQREVLDEYDICDVLFSSIEDCPEFGDRRRRYQIDAYAQTGMLFSHLTNNNLDVEVNSYLNKRRSAETPMWHVGFGVRLSTQWTSGISLRGGLQIAQSQIRVDYRDETERQTTVNVSIDTLVDDNGNTTVVWDTISIIETGVEDRQFHNTFTQIDIPLTVGYTFFGPRYDVEVNAGVMFNVLFQRSGRVFGPEEDQFYELGRTGAPPGTQPYSSDLGVSVITSVALNYRLSPQFSVFVEPQLRYFLDPVSPGGYALQENWFMGSLMLGGRYAF